MVPLLAVFAVLPGVYQNHLLLFNFVIFLILAQGVNIIYGFTGYLPFGYVGFFGAGAYGFAVMVMHFQTPAALAVIGGRGWHRARPVADAAVAFVRRVFRDRQSCGVALAVLHFVANPALENITQGPVRRLTDRNLQSDLAYAAALVVLSLTLGAVVFLKNSRFGLALQAVREERSALRWPASMWCGCA